MYSIDGVALQNPANGWRFKRTSEPLVGRGIDRPDFNASNRNGTVAVRGHVTTPTVTLVVTAPGSTREALSRLLRRGVSVTLTSDPSVVLNVQILTLTPVTITPAGGGIYELTAVYRVAPDVWWRDAATTDYVFTVPSAGAAGAANVDVLDGTSGSVQDALILVQGGMVNPKFTGGNGTWVSYVGTCPTNLLIDTKTGRCYSTVSGDHWNLSNPGVVEKTAYLNSGPYPYFLELFPASTGPASCTLGVSWDSVPGPATVTVRAANAYDR